MSADGSDAPGLFGRTFEPRPGMAASVFRDKYSRQGQRSGEGPLVYETWADVARRVVDGNFALTGDPAEKYRRTVAYNETLAAATAGVLPFSGRHLQHGDLDQPGKTGELFMNCTTAMFSWASFLLLMKGCGVGRDYSSDMCFVNWDYLPECRFVLDGPDASGVGGHPDYQDWIESLDDARHKYGSEGESVRWFEVDDSAEGWAKVVMVMETAAYHRHNADTIFVFDFSKVRPAGAPLKGQQGRPASGPVPLIRALQRVMSIRGTNMQNWKQALFIDHYLASSVVAGGVRRSARIAVKSCYDRDVIEFIDVKRGGHLWSANNSIAVVDQAFWEKASSPKPTHERRVFEAAVASSYWDDTGEPGFFNAYLVNDDPRNFESVTPQAYVDPKMAARLGGLHRRTEEMIAYHLERAKARRYRFIPNPCLTGDTLIAVAGRGPMPIATLAAEGRDVPVFAVDPSSGEIVVRWGRAPRLTKKSVDVVRVTLDDGSYLRVTPDHKFPLRDGRKVEAKDLRAGDSLFRFDRRESVSNGELNVVIGDRREQHVILESKYGRRFDWGRNVGQHNAHHANGDHSDNSWNNLEVITHEDHIVHHQTGDDNVARAASAARYADGTFAVVPRELRVCPECGEDFCVIETSPKKFCSRRCSNANRNRAFTGSTMGYSRKFVNHKVTSVEPDGVEDVYNVTVDEFHNYAVVTNIGTARTGATRHSGVFVCNCGEIPLFVGGGYCNIGDVCLAEARSTEEALIAGRRLAEALVRVNTMDLMYAAETRRTNRIGVSLTGIHEFAYRAFGLGFRDLIDERRSAKLWRFIADLRDAVEHAADGEARRRGLPPPATYTCVKPSGTVSKVMSSTEGAHLPATRHYIRWTMAVKGSTTAHDAEDRGYRVKDVSHRYPDTVVIGYPTCLPFVAEAPDEAIVTAAEATPADQYRWLRLLEKNWLGEEKRNGQVSYTLKWRKSATSYEEYCRMVLEQQPTVRCCSLMPEIDQDASAYAYLPEEPITRELYDALVARITNPIGMESYSGEDLMCAGGVCPIEDDIHATSIGSAPSAAAVAP